MRLERSSIAPAAAAAAALLACCASSYVTAFAPSLGAVRPSTTTMLGAEATAKKNVLEGKEIDGDFTPVNNMLLVKKAGIVDTTEGGIFLTGKQKISKSEGLVVSVGPGRTNTETGYQSEMPISAGEKVLFDKYVGIEVNYNDEKHTLIRDDDVMVKFPTSDDSDLTKVEVLWDTVLVKVPKIEEEASSSGILFAKTNAKKKKSSVGEVIKVGPGRCAFNGEVMDMDVEEGDFVKFRDFACQEVDVGEDEYAVVRMTDILAKF